MASALNFHWVIFSPHRAQLNYCILSNFAIQLLWSHSPTSCNSLHSVNHASRTAPWSPLTLKWWKGIKLITDNRGESWQYIKISHWSAVTHFSAVFYDGENMDGFPSLSSPTSINPSHLQTSHRFTMLHTDYDVRCSTTFIHFWLLLMAFSNILYLAS